MEKRLVQLERRWRKTRSVGDESRYLLALIASGQLAVERVGMAGALGYRAALACGVRTPLLPDHHRSRIEVALKPLSPREAVKFGVDCASRALGVWEVVRPDDHRPRAAVEAASSWLEGAANIGLLEARAKAASQAGAAEDNPNKIPADAVLIAAIEGADAASNAALAAAEAGRLMAAQCDEVGGTAYCVAFACRCAVAAAADPEDERDWQIGRLVCYLLGRSDT